MPMSTETPSKPTKLCPTCGTRVSEDATRCLVCGSDLSDSDKPERQARAVQGSRMPEITLSLPIALGLLAMFLLIGAVLVFFAMRETPEGIAEVLPTPTETATATLTTTPTPETPVPTDTPLPTATPISYEVKANETCLGIAASFEVSVNSIVLLNNLSADCIVFEGQQLLIPQPTPTPTPLPSATLSAAESTDQACEKAEHTVQEGDTLSTISQAYGVPMAAIRDYNGLTNDIVFQGLTLTIPLCEQFPTPGPSPTPTPPPPYAAPNLLLPADGEAFSASNDAVTLQWASVGTLTETEAYIVTVAGLPVGDDQLVDYVTDTKYIVPSSFLSRATTAKAYRWTVAAARQVGTDDDGEPVWESAGTTSNPRVFIWSGGGAVPTPETTPTP